MPEPKVDIPDSDTLDDILGEDVEGFLDQSALGDLRTDHPVDVDADGDEDVAFELSLDPKKRPRVKPEQSEIAAVNDWWEITENNLEFDKAVKRWKIDRELLFGHDERGREEGVPRHIRTLRNRDILVSLLSPDRHQVTFKPAEEFAPVEIGMDDVGSDRRLEAFSRTLTLNVRAVARERKLKPKLRAWVRKGASYRCAWMKVTWQNDYHFDPMTSDRPDDEQDNIAKLALLFRRWQNSDFTENDKEWEEMIELTSALRVNAELDLFDSIAIDILELDRIKVDPDVTAPEMVYQAKWISEEDNLTDDEILQKYVRVHPEDLKGGRGVVANVPMEGGKASSADRSRGIAHDPTNLRRHDSKVREDEPEPTRRVREVYSRLTRCRYVIVEGLDYFAHREIYPDATSKFYPYHPFILNAHEDRLYGISQTEMQQTMEEQIQKIRDDEDAAREAAVPRGVYNNEVIKTKSLESINSIPKFGLKGVGMDRGEMEDHFFMIPTTGTINPSLYDTTNRERDQDNAAMIPAQIRGETGVADFAAEVNAAVAGTNRNLQLITEITTDQIAEVYDTIAQLLLMHEGPKRVQMRLGEDIEWPEDAVERETLYRFLNVKIRVTLNDDLERARSLEGFNRSLETLRALGITFNPAAVAQVLGEMQQNEDVMARLFSTNARMNVEALAADQTSIEQLEAPELQILGQLGATAMARLEQMLAEAGVTDDQDEAPAPGQARG